MRKLGPISLPQDHPQDYHRRLAVMLYQYLNETRQGINALIDLQSSTAITGYAPLTTGAEPIELVSDGAGQCVMVPYP